MNFSRSSPAEDEGEVDLAGGGREEAWECNWQGEGAGEGSWPLIGEGWLRAAAGSVQRAKVGDVQGE